MSINKAIGGALSALVAFVIGAISEGLVSGAAAQWAVLIVTAVVSIAAGFGITYVAPANRTATQAIPTPEPPL